ncbi:oligosaccharyltransferase complex subunit ostc [Anaeramoeba flamelloides]|uniref:Oligosaccharyltransferase complex subunit ostc n=1 Tax=Anaeramoeba flamelloides TaxID=1746091 RepID=A0AAV7ZI03_9EUKA|nr:oligosaccharyltransferase complex subunit ostc [Anaeramoeba flamelloides]KAJ6226656.1 oligosaccharyltransferase complex subunit ostc [Anaeramoeba flamelloides]
MNKKLNFLESSFCKVLRPPQLNLRIIKPSSMAVFAFVLFALFIVFAGVIYDLIVEPPSIGVEYGFGNERPVTILKGRLNSQYIFEGIDGALFYLLGSLGLILIDQALTKERREKYGKIMFYTGVGLFACSFVIIIFFIKLKVPGYLKR